MATSPEMCQAARTERTPAWLTAAAARPGLFVSDAGLAALCGAAPPTIHTADDVGIDPTEAAWQDGYSAGLAAAVVQANARDADDSSAHADLRLAFARLDDAARRELAERLAAIVARLCEDAIAPAILDREGLRERCEAAASSLGDAPGRLALHLNGRDTGFLHPETADRWTIVADDAVPRGSFRLEGIDGGVADDPADWAERLQAALAAC